jgi:hypothetical protein
MRIGYALVLTLLTACHSNSPPPPTVPSSPKPDVPVAPDTVGGGGAAVDLGAAPPDTDPPAPPPPTPPPPPPTPTPDLAVTTPPPVDNFPYVTDYSSRPMKPVALPAKFGSYVDPVFGSKIIRVTDATSGTHCVNAYSYWPAFNRDSTRLLISCDAVAHVYRFDPTTDQLAYDGPLVTAGGPTNLQFEGAYWSHNEPTVLYALGGTKLWRVDTAQSGAARFTLVRDFGGLFGGSWGAFQLGKADDDNIFTFSTRESSSGRGLEVVVYKRDTNQTFVFPRPSDFLVDESQVSKDGRYVIIPSRDDIRRWAIWTWSTNAVDLFGWNPTERAGGHYDAGRLKLVSSDNWNTGFQKRDFTPPGSHAPVNFWRTFGTDGKTVNWGVPNHVSMRSDDESFIIVTTYGALSGEWQPFEKEVILIRTDGSGFVRLGHTRSMTRDNEYFSQPRGVVDRLGRYVVYTTDLGSSTRRDVVILKIPAKFAGTVQ